MEKRYRAPTAIFSLGKSGTSLTGAVNFAIIHLHTAAALGRLPLNPSV
jgi:hypothetical protein